MDQNFADKKWPGLEIIWDGNMKKWKVIKPSHALYKQTKAARQMRMATNWIEYWNKDVKDHKAKADKHIQQLRKNKTPVLWKAALKNYKDQKEWEEDKRENFRLFTNKDSGSGEGKGWRWADTQLFLKKWQQTVDSQYDKMLDFERLYKMFYRAANQNLKPADWKRKEEKERKAKGGKEEAKKTTDEQEELTIEEIEARQYDEEEEIGDVSEFIVID
jgi:hypothetical protein